MGVRESAIEGDVEIGKDDGKGSRVVVVKVQK